MDPLSFLRAHRDRVVAVGIALAGLVAMLLGWVGTSSTVYPAEQIPYILSGGIVGLLLIAVAATLWVSADLRDEWLKLDRLEDLLRERLPETTRADEPAGEATVAEPALEAVPPASANGHGHGEPGGRSRRAARKAITT